MNDQDQLELISKTEFKVEKSYKFGYCIYK